MFQAVVYPVNYMTFSRSSAVVSVVVIWIFSVFICIPSMMEIIPEYCKTEGNLWLTIFVNLVILFKM